MRKRLDYARDATLDDKLLLSAQDVASKLTLGTQMIYKMAKRGEIASVRIGQCVRFPRVAVEQYVARLCREQGVEVDA